MSTDKLECFALDDCSQRTPHIMAARTPLILVDAVKGVE